MTHPIFALGELLDISPLSLREGGGERGDFYVPLHIKDSVPDDAADIKETTFLGAFLNLYMTDLWYVKALNALYCGVLPPMRELKPPKNRLQAVNDCLKRIAEYLGTEFEPIERVAPSTCRDDAVLYLSKPPQQEIKGKTECFERADLSFYIFNTYRHASNVYKINEDDAAFCPDGSEKPLLRALLMAEPDVYRAAEKKEPSVLYRRAVKIADAFWEYYSAGDILKQKKLVMCNLTAKELCRLLYFMGKTSYDEN